MEPIETFAKGAHTSSTVMKDTKLAAKIIEYYEPARQMRQFCFDYKIDKLSTVLPKDPGSTDMAVELAEMSDIPLARTSMESVPLVVVKNGTRFFMSDEAEIEDTFGTLYEREAKEAGERMARKEDYDISSVLQGGSYESFAASHVGELNTFDLARAKALLRTHEFEATDLLINPEQWADIEGEALLQNMQYTSEGAKYSGKNASTVMGLNVTLINKITAGTALVMCKPAQPVWYVYNPTTKTEPKREEGKGRGALITAYWKPVVMRATAIVKITSC